MNVSATLPLEPDLPADPPDAYVEGVVRRAGTSFYWGMRRLPPERRRGVYAVYAFCRDVDDVADGDLPLSEKRARLDAWRAEIAALYDGAPGHPITRALQGPVADYDLQRADFLAVIDGMEMDAAPRVRIADMDELRLYCDRVACAVGRLSARTFGLPRAEGDALSAALGQAMQVTNILRDIVEDAARDRVYLPADLLRDAGATGAGTDDILAAPGLPDLCARLAEQAAADFAEAERIINAADPVAARPPRMMMQVYKRILENLRRRGWRNLDQPVGPSRLGKLLIAVRYGLFA